MKKLFLFVLCASLFIGCKKEAVIETATTTADTATTVAPVEFADAKYSDIGKKSLDALSKGDMENIKSDYNRLLAEYDDIKGHSDFQSEFSTGIDAFNIILCLLLAVLVLVIGKSFLSKNIDHNDLR